MDGRAPSVAGRQKSGRNPPNQPAAADIFPATTPPRTHPKQICDRTYEKNIMSTQSRISG